MRKELYDLAFEKKEELTRRASQLEKQLGEVKGKLKQLEAETRELPEKLRRVEVLKSETALVCPYCFIDNGQKIELTSIPSENEEDNFKCKKCDFEISLSA